MYSRGSPFEFRCCDPDHIPSTWTSDRLTVDRQHGMRERFIAAMVLASLVWSCVPMLAMMPAAAMPHASPHHAAAGTHDHSCCPGVHSQRVPPIFVKAAPGGMPCDEQHPCCARQGPENPPSLPATTRSRPDSHAVAAIVADHSRVSPARIAVTGFGRATWQPQFERSTVLRI